MRSIIKMALNFRYIVLVLSIGLLVAGVTRLRQAPVDLLPEFSAVVVEIQTEALGLPAAEVEAMITVPLEEFLSGMAWLQEVRSSSLNGLSSIELEFEPGTELMQARQMVQERLIHSAALPNVSKPPAMLQPVSSINRVMNVALSSESVSLIDLSVLAQWKIKPRLMGVPGVANVALWGHRARQLQVQVDPSRLSEHGVTLSDVVAATGNGLWVTPLSYLNASTPGNGGFIDMPNQRLDIRHVLPISSAEDLARIAFGNDRGETVTLGEVATVVEGHPPLIGDAVAGSDARIQLVVERFPWANAIDVTHGVDEALAALRPGLPGIEVFADNFRAADLVEEARGDIAGMLLLGWVLAAVALFVLLPWRAAVIGTAVSAVSIAAAALVLISVAKELDLVLVTGLVAAIAVLVGDLTLSLQRLMWTADTGLSGPGGAMERLSRFGTTEGSASLYGFAASIFVCVAVLVLDLGVDAFVVPLLTAYLLALAAALAVGIVLVPTLVLLMPPGAALSVPLLRLANGMTRTASARTRVAVPVGLAAVALLSIALAGTRLIPAFEERDLLWHLQMPPSASAQKVNGLAEEVVGELRGVGGVESVSAEIGRATMSDSRAEVNAADLWIRLAPGADHDDTLQAIDAIARRYPGLDSRPTTFTAERLASAVRSDPDTLVTRVYGPDLDTLRRQATSLATGIGALPGVARAEAETLAERRQIEVMVDLDKAERYGLTPGEIRRSASIILAGLEVGNLFEDQKVFEVVVWGEPRLRRDATSVAGTPIRTPDGRIVPLSALADVREASGPSVILREGGSRHADITARLDGRSRAEVVEAIGGLIATRDFPLEYHAEVRDVESSGSDPLATVLVLGMAALGVLLVVQAAVDDWRLGIAAVASPVVGVGVVLVATNLTGGLSLGAVAAVAAVTYLATRLAVSAAVREEIGGGIESASGNLAVLIVVTAFLLPALVIGVAGGLGMIVDTAALLFCGTLSAVAFTLLGTATPRSVRTPTDDDPLERADALPLQPEKDGRSVSAALPLVAVVTLAALLSPEADAATDAAAHATTDAPGIVRHLPDDEVARIVLTRKAMERLGVETEPVTQARMHRPRRFYGMIEAVSADGNLIVRSARDGGEGPTPTADDRMRIVALRGANGTSGGTSRSSGEWIARSLPRQGHFALEAGGGSRRAPTVGEVVELFPLPGGEAPIVSLIPRGAFLYDEHGGSWVYCMVAGGVFERHAVTPDFLVGERVAISEGPAVDMPVVFIGAAELHGIEFEVGH